MRPHHLPSGLRGGLDFLICADWTPDQALAIVELLDDLRDRIWAHYDLALFDLLREERGGPSEPFPADYRPADGPDATETRATMAWVLDQSMILLNPFMPFITEELWGTTADPPF